MEEKSKNKVSYIESKQKNLLYPSIFLGVVIIITLGLFIYNSYLQGQIEDLKSKTDEMNVTLVNLQARPEIQVYELLENNSNTIETLEKRTHITKYMNHLATLSSPSKYDIKFGGFSINKGEISTTAIAESGNKIAYQKVADFISGYREDPEALLNLNFVDLVEGMDTIKFNLTFTIK